MVCFGIVPGLRMLLDGVSAPCDHSETYPAVDQVKSGALLSEGRVDRACSVTERRQ